jgi:hypothetical protein
MPRVLESGKENATFQTLQALKTNREKRNKLGFVFEGVRNIVRQRGLRREVTTGSPGSV